MKPHATVSLTPSLKRYLKKTSLSLRSSRCRLSTEPLADWALGNIVLDGGAFSFKRHEYLRALYNDTAPHVVVMKAAQVGGTTWALLKTIHACLTGHDVIYFSPTKTAGWEFSKSRFDPLVEENPALAKLVTTDTAGYKRIGNSRLFFRGTRSDVDLKSVPADFVVLDELDEVTPRATSQAKARLHHSAYRFLVELSNPSVPDFGIHQAFDDSDQRQWMIKCSGCSHWWCLEREFPKQLGQQVKVLRRLADGSCLPTCPSCDRELDVAKGEWVATFPNRDIHGYHISQLMSEAVDPADILKEYETTRYPDVFYNLRLGTPYTDLQRRLEASFVLTLCGEHTMLESSEQPCVMGVDVGSQLHVVILREDQKRDGLYHLVRLQIAHSFEELDDLMRRFEVATCVIDAQPEQHSARTFAARHPGQVFVHYFNENQRGAPSFDLPGARVESNRTEALDASRAAMRDRLVVLPRCEPIVELFAHHMSADAKKLEEDPNTGLRKYGYFKTGDNDFSLAFTYAWLGTQCPQSYEGLLEFYRQELLRLEDD